jgi:hypothetical protein
MFNCNLLIVNLVFDEKILHLSMFGVLLAARLFICFKQYFAHIVLV